MPISIAAKGIEWYDHMPLMNEVSNHTNMRWFIRDVQTGKENHAIHWTFKAGEKVKIRIRNDTTKANSHPMPHPIHFHGQRFLVVARNGQHTTNRAWKDTAVLPSGETMDILLELTNPGRWMMHCHVAEHLGTGMMGVFRVSGEQ